MAHFYVSYIAAALLSALDLYSVEGVIHIAVPYPDVTDTARHLGAYGQAVTEVAYTVKDTDVLARTRYYVSFGIFTRLYRYSIVAREELGCEDRTVGRRVGIPAVTVPHSLRAEGAIMCNNVI